MVGQWKFLRSVQIIYVPPVYTFYKIIGKWYSVTRLENWSHKYKKGNKTKVNNYRLTTIVIKYLKLL